MVPSSCFLTWDAGNVEHCWSLVPFVKAFLKFFHNSCGDGPLPSSLAVLQNKYTRSESCSMVLLQRCMLCASLVRVLTLVQNHDSLQKSAFSHSLMSPIVRPSGHDDHKRSLDVIFFIILQDFCIYHSYRYQSWVQHMCAPKHRRRVIINDEYDAYSKQCVIYSNHPNDPGARVPHVRVHTLNLVSYGAYNHTSWPLTLRRKEDLLQTARDSVRQLLSCQRTKRKVQFLFGKKWVSWIDLALDNWLSAKRKAAISRRVIRTESTHRTPFWPISVTKIVKTPTAETIKYTQTRQGRNYYHPIA